MRKQITKVDSDIPAELSLLYQRIDSNSKYFGMTKEEVAEIKKECKIAFQHKLILKKAEQKRKV